MNKEEHSTGIPTRAIHEAYLAMQQSLRQYRNAKDSTDDRAMSVAHGELQQSVLTLYELLRPHLKDEAVVRGWWDGKLPPYPKNGGVPDPDAGKGVLQVQTTHQGLSRQALAEGLDEDETLDGISDFKELHEAAGLNGNVRIVGASPQEDTLFLTLQQYQIGLRHLDDWDTKYVRKRESMGGFMEDKTQSSIDRQRIPVDRLKRAARELGDVAKELELLTYIDSGRPFVDLREEIGSSTYSGPDEVDLPHKNTNNA